LIRPPGGHANALNFPSEDAAQAMANELNRNHEHKGDFWNPVKCVWCNDYHVWIYRKQIYLTKGM